MRISPKWNLIRLDSNYTKDNWRTKCFDKLSFTDKQITCGMIKKN